MGLNQIYPKIHKKYVSEVNKNGGFFHRVFGVQVKPKVKILKTKQD